MGPLKPISFDFFRFFPFVLISLSEIMCKFSFKHYQEIAIQVCNTRKGKTLRNNK